MKTTQEQKQKTIIRSDFEEKDFQVLIEAYLIAFDLSPEEKTELKNRLENFSPIFSSLLKPYFDTEKKYMRFDEITNNLIEFIRRIKISISQKKGNNTAFISFWKYLASKIDTQAREINDNYLINCCHYLKFEIDKL